MPIVILRDKDGQRVLPIWVGLFEANAIALQIENVVDAAADDARPAAERHRGPARRRSQKIVVCDLQDNTFYALIYLARARRHGRDRRPAERRDRPGAADAGADLRRRHGHRQREDGDLTADKNDSERLQKWLESLDPEDLGKYKM